MRIIFLLRSVVLSGGIERVVTEKANWLSCHNHQVLFLTYEQGSHNLSFPLDSNVVHEDLGCPYYTVYKHNILVRPFYMLMFKYKFCSRLKTKIKSFHPDVMVIPSNITEFFGPAISMRNLVPVVFECHSTNVELTGLNHSLKQHYRKYQILYYIKRCSLVVSLTDGDAQYWRKHCKHVAVVPNPLSYYPDLIETKKKVPSTIICVARLQMEKRVDRLIEAFSLISSKYPDWHIDIYGEGVDKAHINQLIQNYGLSNKITICPPIRTIYEEYRKSQFLVLSSDSESFSLVIIEAMACGIPVVSTDCPFGPREIIDDGKTGLLSRLEADDLAAKMEWMIIHESERQKMGLLAHQAVSKYEKNRVMEEWENVYLSIIK